MSLSELTTKNWIKTDPYYQEQKCRPMTLVSGGIRFRGGFLGRGRQTIVGLSRMAIFSVFAGYFSETLEMRPALLYSDTQSIVSFLVIQKFMTLNDIEWLFLVKSVFAPVWLGRTVRLSKNNCVKTNEDRHMMSAVQIFSKNSSFWHIRLLRTIVRVL